MIFNFPYGSVHIYLSENIFKFGWKFVLLLSAEGDAET